MDTIENEIIAVEVEEDVIEVSVKAKKKKTSLRDAVTKRFANAPWAAKREVTLGGGGGIGSNLAYILIKLGYDIALFEYDVVEPLNIGGQMFYLDDVGETKAFAITRMATKVNKDSKIFAAGQLTQYATDEFINPITLVGFDSIEARRILFEKWYATYKDAANAIFIESRQNAEDFEIFAVTPDKADRYRETLFTEEIEELPCNYKSTTQTGFINAGMMIGIMTNFISNLDNPDIRIIPFRTSFCIPMMYYERTN